MKTTDTLRTVDREIRATRELLEALEDVRTGLVKVKELSAGKTTKTANVTTTAPKAKKSKAKRAKDKECPVCGKMYTAQGFPGHLKGHEVE